MEPASHAPVTAMCRLSAYVGPEIRLDRILLAPSHGLLNQALHPRELRFARFNADGYGFGWYDGDDKPATYVSAQPIWSDPNLAPLATSLCANVWLAHVRAATLPQSGGWHNNQPFRDDNLLFVHNGFLDDFGPVKRCIREFLDPQIDDGITASTDSAYVFALLRHLLADDADLGIDEALVEVVGLLDDWIGTRRMLLNLAVTDGDRIYAIRHARNAECPSLYVTEDDEAFPDGQLLASEPMTDSEYWQPVSEHHLLILDPEHPPESIAL